MTVGIAGLGLIGGSLARAYKRNPGIRVLGFDRDISVMQTARQAGVIDGTLDSRSLPECDLLLIALYPQDAAEYLRFAAPHCSAGALAIDCCGTKRAVCKEGFRLAAQYGFVFAGGHPMAGTQFSGFQSSDASLFDGACMVIVPPDGADEALFARIQSALMPVGFASITAATAEKHDAMIAYTSQMAHVVSNAYVKSPAALEHRGFSAGSFRDLTRVARLNPEMWSALFIENADNLVREIDGFLLEMSRFRDAIAKEDGALLRRLLAEGCARKEEADGR